MELRKRSREPDEAPPKALKRHLVREKPRAPDRIPQPNPATNNAEDPGGPEPPVQTRKPRPRRKRNPRNVPPPPGHTDPRARLRPRAKPNASTGQLPPQRPLQRGRPRPRLRLNPPMPPDQPSPSRAGPGDPESSDSEASTCYSQPVAHYDVAPGVAAVGVPRASDLALWGSRPGAAAFIRSRSGLEGEEGEEWIGVRPLGKGGCGIAGLWEVRGDDGRVVKQMVVKEETHTRSRWGREADLREVPVEARVMGRLNKTRCHAIPRLFSYKRYPHVYKHRFYMEYCPFQDLSILCRRYGRFRQYFPEPFLWDTFYHLVEAAVAMSDGPKDQGWGFEIVHRDLKPGNVFLGDTNPEQGFPFYPVAKTGDFGLAVMTHAGDPSNPRAYQGAGTLGYKAPEQQLDDTPKKHQHRLSSSTNVWAIGATMLELVTLYPHADYMNDPEYSNDGMIVAIQTCRQPEYSAALRKLVRQCVRPAPGERIKLRRLRARVRSHRDRILDEYRTASGDERARFETDSRLYYVRNEINHMPTGAWEPWAAERPSKPEPGIFPDPDWPVVFPRFDDAPEVGGEDGNDADDDGDDDSDGDTTSSRPRLGPGGAEDGGPRSGGAEGGGSRDGEAGSGRSHGAVSRGSARAGGGVDGREHDRTRGPPLGGSDDGSQDMEVESDGSAAPSPSRRQAPALAPPDVPAVQPVPRTLRSGKVIGYF